MCYSPLYTLPLEDKSQYQYHSIYSVFDWYQNMQYHMPLMSSQKKYYLLYKYLWVLTHKYL